MESPDQTVQPVRRSAFWYLKWVVASFAAAFCIFLVFVLSLPFVGTRVADTVFEHRSILFGIMVAVSPFVFRHLK